MATWGLHIRVAEKLLKRGYVLDREKFLIGNIGPDCGMPNEDWSRFNPPREISHWCDRDGRNITPERFFETYLSERVGDLGKRSFYLGYYVHLLLDIEWGKIIDRKKEKDRNYAPLREDKRFIWTIKKDWYDLDHLYFQKNRDSLFFKIFPYVERVPHYLDYYPRGAISRQIRYITDFYQNPPENLDREYIYLSEKEMDDFVVRSSAYLELVLEEKSLC